MINFIIVALILAIATTIYFSFRLYRTHQKKLFDWQRRYQQQVKENEQQVQQLTDGKHELELMCKRLELENSQHQGREQQTQQRLQQQLTITKKIMEEKKQQEQQWQEQKRQFSEQQQNAQQQLQTIKIELQDSERALDNSEKKYEKLLDTLSDNIQILNEKLTENQQALNASENMLKEQLAQRSNIENLAQQSSGEYLRLQNDMIFQLNGILGMLKSLNVAEARQEIDKVIIRVHTILKGIEPDYAANLGSPQVIEFHEPKPCIGENENMNQRLLQERLTNLLTQSAQAHTPKPRQK